MASERVETDPLIGPQPRRTSEPSGDDHRAPFESDVIEVAVVVTAAVTIGIAAVGLVSAMIGQFSPWPVTVAGVAVALGSLVLWLRLGGVDLHVSWREPALIPPVLLAMSIAWWSAGHAGQTLQIRRDPGSYLNTARWLIREGSLTASADTPLLSGLPDISFASPAVYDMGAGSLEFQFSHGPAVIFATAYEALGSRLLFNANVIIGAMALLAWYCILRRLRIGPWISLAAIAALGLSIPFLNVTRATYSEPLVLLLVATGVLLLVSAADRSRPERFVFLAGLVVGGTVMFRVDGLVYLAAFFIATAAMALSGEPRTAIAAVAGAAVPTLIGVIDQQYYTGNYASDLRESVVQLSAATALSLLALIVAGFLGSRRPRKLSLPPTGSRILAVGVSSVILAAWIVRPHLETATKYTPNQHPGTNLIAGLQARDGLQIQASRTYAELSVSQIGWYFGVGALAAASLGFGMLAYRAARRPVSAEGVLALFAAVAAPLYIWKPNIFPDHPWLTRRFVPFIYPIVLAAAALAFQVFTDRAREIAGQAGRVVTALACLTFVVPTIAATYPVRDMTDQRGVYGTFVELCKELSPDTTVLTVDFSAIDMTLRSWCGVAVANTTSGSTAIEALADRASSACAQAVVVTPAGASPPARAELFEQPREYRSAAWDTVEFTLIRRPDRMNEAEFALTIWPVALDDSCTTPEE